MTGKRKQAISSAQRSSSESIQRFANARPLAAASVGTAEIVSVAQVQPLDGAITPVSEQLGQLRTLSPGWLDGHGVPPSAESIEWTAQILGQLPSDGSIPRPYLYPTPEGSIQAEWDIGPWSVTAEVDVASRCLSVSALNTQTQAGLDKDFTENHPHELANFLLFLKPDQRAN